MRCFCLSLFAALLLLFGGCATARLTMSASAMEPTIPAGSTFAIDADAYEDQDPRRFDIVTFIYRSRTGLRPIQQPPDGAEICYRIVGLPGERVEVTAEGLRINGQPIDLPAGLEVQPAPVSEEYHRYNSVNLPANAYYLLGDNTNKALDSRYWGFIRRDQITGKVVLPE